MGCLPLQPVTAHGGVARGWFAMYRVWMFELLAEIGKGEKSFSYHSWRGGKEGGAGGTWDDVVGGVTRRRRMCSRRVGGGTALFNIYNFKFITHIFLKYSY